MPNGKTLAELQERDAFKHEVLRRYVDLEVIWEHEINAELKRDKEMKKFFDNWSDNSPIRIRDAFFGGRTGAKRLIYRVKPGKYLFNFIKII